MACRTPNGHQLCKKNTPFINMKTKELPATPLPTSSRVGKNYLDLSVKSWFIVATLGQWIFGLYIALFYGKSTLSGEWEKWNKVLPHGYVKDDLTGNLIVAAHVFFALIMVVGGPLQLIPRLRNRFKTAHRWLGRTYILTAILIALDGLIMVWTRGAVGGLLQHIAISIQAVYMVVFALLAYHYARQRDFVKHRQWAIRLYLVSNGVWFFRVSLMAWLMLNGGPAGFDPKTFDGPFLWFLAIAIYALPVALMVFELYLYAQKNPSKPLLQRATASLLFLLTGLMLVGIVAATMGLWIPRM